MKLSELSLFKGKPQSEIYKTIAAIVLGVLAVIALTWGIILPMFAGKKTSRRTPDATSPTATDVATKTSPGQTPAPPVKPLPPQNEIDLLYQTLPVVFNIGGYSASPPGRNIFAFYEPPKPTP